METIFDAKITKEEFAILFKDYPRLTYDNYLSIMKIETHNKYHLARLMFMRGNEEEGNKYLKESNVPIGMDVDWAG